MKRFAFLVVVLGVAAGASATPADDVEARAVLLRTLITANPQLAGALFRAAPDLLKNVVPEGGAGSRRRGVMHPPPTSAPPPTGGCVAVPLPAQGRVANYIEHLYADPMGLNPTSTLTYTYKTSTASHQEFSIHTETSTSMGSMGATDTIATLDFVPAGDSLALTNAKIDLTMSLLGFPIEAIYDTHFTVPFATQPLSQWCAGATWPIGATTWYGNVTAAGQGGQFSLPVPAATGRIYTRETITVPAGTFDTFKMIDYLGSFLSLSPDKQPGTSNFGNEIEWIDVRTGLPVQWNFLDANGALTGTIQMTSYR